MVPYLSSAVADGRHRVYLTGCNSNYLSASREDREWGGTILQFRHGNYGSTVKTEEDDPST